MLGHDEGLCEAIYLTLADNAGLNPPQWHLFNIMTRYGQRSWLGLKRFDFVKNINGKSGRLLMHSAGGLLDADFRLPSLDYEDLIRVNRTLCKSVQAGQLQFKRAIFNLLSSNQDGHSKNWAFLQSDDGQWQPAPFYDVTFNPNPMNEHTTSFGGYGKRPPLATIQKLANTAGYDNWEQAKIAIEEIADVISNFSETAKNFDVSKKTIQEVEEVLSQRLSDNQHLYK